MAKKRDIAPIHPGEILLEEFLVPMGVSQYRLAKDISVPQRRIGAGQDHQKVNFYEELRSTGLR